MAEDTDFLAPDAVAGNEIQTCRRRDVSSSLRLVIPRKKALFLRPIHLEDEKEMRFVEISGCDFLVTQRGKSEK